MKASDERRNVSYPVALAGRQFDAAGAVQNVQAHADIKRVLTKKFFMCIIHRITIQRDVGYNLSFALSYSKVQFLRQSKVIWKLLADKIPERCLLIGRY